MVIIILSKKVVKINSSFFTRSLTFSSSSRRRVRAMSHGRKRKPAKSSRAKNEIVAESETFAKLLRIVRIPNSLSFAGEKEGIDGVEDGARAIVIAVSNHRKGTAGK